jgi:hypothetical protein
MTRSEIKFRDDGHSALYLRQYDSGYAICGLSEYDVAWFDSLAELHAFCRFVLDQPPKDAA